MTTRTLFAAFAALLVVSEISAHMAPMTAQKMVYDSRYVVVGTVVERTTARVGLGRLIVTRYRVAVEEGLRGDPPDELVVEVVGGTMDGETQASCLTVQLELGRRYLLYVNDPKNPGLSTFTGAQQGVIGDPGSGATVAASPSFAGLTRGQATTFPELVDAMRTLIKNTEAVPAPPQPAPVVHDPPLPGKRYEMQGEEPLVDLVPVMPLEAPQTLGPEAPANPDIVNLDASHAVAAPPLPVRGERSVVLHLAPQYIVWNQLPSSYTPWSPHDQSMMLRWNLYGDIHRVSANPTNSFGWGNNRYDIAGFVPSPTMFLVYGRMWGPNELAICFNRWVTNGQMVESDILVNPAWPWTTDNEVGTHHDDWTPWGFDQTILHEEGHAWGLQHPWEFQDVWWDSVMNYSPKEYRLPNLHADDTAAIRGAYPGSSFHDGLVSFYSTLDNPLFIYADYQNADPSFSYVQQLGTFHLNHPFWVENVGTDNIVNPQVDVYLTHSRMSWSAYEYVQSLNFATTIPPNSYSSMSSGDITVPASTPPGEYYVALWLRDNADAQWYNNEAWQTNEFGTVKILSYPWTIFPASYWQYQEVRTGPYGSYDFYFNGVADTRVDVSTCPADGGDATFDTILDLYDSANNSATNDDACGSQSRLSWLVVAPGSHRIVLRGWTYAYGTSRMMYRLRTWANSPLALTVDKNVGSGTVRLSWAGDVGPYDVQRSTTPNFTNPVLIGNGQAGSTLDDPVLNDGGIYYYRAR